MLLNSLMALSTSYSAAPDSCAKVQLYLGPELAAYGFGHDHPFGTDRMDAFWQHAQTLGLKNKVDIAKPVMAERMEIERFHTPDYIDRVIRQSASGDGYLDYGDTPAFKGVYEAACTVVGTVLAAAEEVIHGRHQRCFIPIAGLHHSKPQQAAGFCVFNDAGVLIQTLRQVYDIRRIAYVDIDAHHGDGVFYVFEADPDLCIVDIHESGDYLYPGTGLASESGTGKAKHSKLNIPLKPWADDREFMAAWPEAELFIRNTAPEFIIFQCGADSIAGDPITHLRFSTASHAHAATRLCAIADEFSQGRIIALGGGGYNRVNLAAAWCTVVEQMCSS